MKVYFAGSCVNKQHERHCTKLCKKRLLSYFETTDNHMASDSVRSIFRMLKRRASLNENQ